MEVITLSALSKSPVVGKITPLTIDIKKAIEDNHIDKFSIIGRDELSIPRETPYDLSVRIHNGDKVSGSGKHLMKFSPSPGGNCKWGYSCVRAADWISFVKNPFSPLKNKEEAQAFRVVFLSLFRSDYRESDIFMFDLNERYLEALECIFYPEEIIMKSSYPARDKEMWIVLVKVNRNKIEIPK